MPLLACLLVGLLVATAPARAPTITLAFGGDVHGESAIRAALGRGEDPFAAVASSLARADVALVNLETTVGRGGRPRAKAFDFRAPASLLDAAASAGIDVVGLANNHAVDFGHLGMLSTIAAAHDAGLRPVGAGRDATAAYAPAIVEVDGVRVAFVGLSRVDTDWRVLAGDDRAGIADGFAVERASVAVRSARAQANVVVVTAHMGRERARCPSPRERAFVAAMFSAGATIVAGHHPHVLQPIEHDDGTLVAYSLGNLVFDGGGAPGTTTTGVLTVEVDRDGRVRDHRWDAARIVDGIPRAIPETEQQAERDALERLRLACAKDR